MLLNDPQQRKVVDILQRKFGSYTVDTLLEQWDREPKRTLESQGQVYPLLESHDPTPGKTYDNTYLICSTSGFCFNECVDLNEARDYDKPSVKFRGKFQEAEQVNKNKRMYPYNILESNVKRLIECVKQGGLPGELDHPTDSIVHFQNASHRTTKLWWDNKVLMGEGFVMPTPSGLIMRVLLDEGVRVGISSRGIGNGKVNENGILVIGESYKLITFDSVADPSTHHAFQEKVVSTNEEIVAASPIKTEATSIDKMNSQLLVACLDRVVKQHTKDIKARMYDG